MKYKYPYNCPDCGKVLEFKMTPTKGYCPQCGIPITAREIDKGCGCLEGCGCLAILFFVVLLVVTYVNNQRFNPNPNPMRPAVVADPDQFWRQGGK
jgi:hypothetical protein